MLSETAYQILDYFFVIFHFSLILFNLTGWIWQKTRKLHLYVISVTIFSWIGLGFFYGWGYCPCTDWHWQVKRELGETGLPASYIKYYLDQLFGFSWDSLTVDILVAVLGVGALLVSIVMNYRDKKTQKNQ
ncbi:MAG: DUF2784 domain-containing protein [Gracilimonas sp.]|uniref:DUF2784 domain-containing protein n=1 Tax=Gracilimonas sp. TaxID=1974203 RepID=UPI0019A382C2|nr:DUF2784 domain-containing protein [Gracilimonas sp.]MBD3617319.1 DUF2784 domain-containing protein [Gracilimonas sp.]